MFFFLQNRKQRHGQDTMLGLLVAAREACTHKLCGAQRLYMTVEAV